MTPKRLYIGLAALIGLLLIGLVAGTYGANQLLTTRANQLTSLKVKTLALEQESISLNQAKKEIAQNAPLAAIAQAIVPQDKDQAEAVREIVKIASDNNVKLASITFPASNLGSGPATSGHAPSSAASSATTGATSSKSGALSQLQPVKNIAGVYDLQINIQSDPNDPVTYSQYIGFLSALEQNRRTAQVSGLTIQPTPLNRSLLTFTLTLDEYIRP